MKPALSKANSPKKPQAALARKVYLLGGLLLITIGITIAQSFYTSQVVTRSLSRFGHEAAIAQRDVALAHLWLEEILDGDSTIPVQTAWAMLDSADMALERLCPEKPAKSSILPRDQCGQVFMVRKIVRELKTATGSRLDNSAISGSGTPSDIAYDKLFKRLAPEMIVLEEAVHSATKNRLDSLRTTQVIMLLLCGILILVVGGFAVALERQRTRAISELSRSNNELKSLNQQITAAEQQLRASNQQLSATEQQLRASNQQLEAGEQQLRASNQQLKAGEQQLRASNQQLKASEQAIRISEVKFRSIIEAIPIGMHMYRINNEGQLIFTGANPAADTILGVSNAQFVGRTIEDAFPDLVKTEVPQRYREAALFGTRWQTEQISYHDEQIVGAFEVIAFQTEPGCMAAAFSDITVRANYEKRLEESEAKLLQSQQVAQLGHYEFFTDTGLWTCSKMLDTVFGIDSGYKKDVASWIQIIHPEHQEEMSRYLSEHVLRDHHPFDKEYRIIRQSDGAVRWVHGRGNLEFGKDGKVAFMFGTIQDITEYRQLLNEVQKAQKLDSLGVLAGGIAHDFNNLMGGLFGYIDLARSLCNDGDRCAEYLDKAMGSFRRAKDLTQHLLTFAKGGAPAKHVRRVVPLVKEAVEMALAGSSVRCHYEINDQQLSAAVDETQITQVVSNIVLNARQAMASGGNVVVTITTRKITAADGFPLDPGSYANICIEDHGVGIAPEHLPKIFDPFFSTKQQGSGLGLAITFSIVKKHGGYITVDSVVGKGTRFCVLLPAVLPAGSGHQELHLKPESGHGRILVMDDEEVLRHLVVDVLKGLGYEITTVPDGATAIAEFTEAWKNRKPFDAVILDLTIPGSMGGVDTLKKIKEIDGSIKAIVSSGYSDDPAMANPDQHGFVAKVAKPYRSAELAAVLKKVLG